MLAISYTSFLFYMLTINEFHFNRLFLRMFSYIILQWQWREQSTELLIALITIFHLLYDLIKCIQKWHVIKIVRWDLNNIIKVCMVLLVIIIILNRCTVIVITRFFPNATFSFINSFTEGNPTITLAILRWRLRSCWFNWALLICARSSRFSTEATSYGACK